MLRLLAALLAGSFFGPMVNAMSPPPSVTQAFSLTAPRAVQGAREAWLQVRFASGGRTPASITWRVAGKDGAECTIDGGSYTRGSTRADRGGGLSLRLIDTSEIATDVLFDGERLLFLRRGRVVAKYGAPDTVAGRAACASPPRRD
jgi:hypothetical protein